MRPARKYGDDERCHSRMTAPRPTNQPTIAPASPHAPYGPEASVTTVASPKKTVERIRAHGRPARHFHAIHGHSTMGTTMLRTATTSSSAGTCNADGLVGPAVTRETSPTTPLIRYTAAPAYIRYTALRTDLGAGSVDAALGKTITAARAAPGTA